VGSNLYQDAGQRDFARLCRDMNLNSELPEYPKPKNVGLMFFCLEPDRFFPYAQIDVVQFPDDLGGDQIIEQTFKGPLHQQLRSALLYIRNMVITERVQKLPDVAEANRFFNYPYAAIEEALSNAVYHKGYEIREPIEVRVLLDRIEIHSHPGADRSISIENLKNYRAASRRYRNRRIGEFLKELHLTEGRNTGFQKIIRALKANGSPMPIFETDEERTYFLTTILIHPAFAELNDNRNDNVNDNRNDIKDQKLTDNEQLVLNAIQMDAAITMEKMASMLGVSKATVARATKSLREKKAIDRVGSTKKGKWIILK
jgi:ATP-dependent DNA helicase RecG